MTTKNDINNGAPTSTVKVISDAREEEIRSLFRSLHTKVLTCLTECDIKPTFNDNFAQCAGEDFKLLHQASRALISSKVTARWNAYSGAISAAIQGVISTHMALAREDKAEWDNMSDRAKARSPWAKVVKVPFSDLTPCFPKGKVEGEILVELDKLFPKQVGKGANDTFYLTVPFVESPKVAEVAPSAEETPKSGEAVKAA